MAKTKCHHFPAMEEKKTKHLIDSN